MLQGPFLAPDPTRGPESPDNPTADPAVMLSGRVETFEPSHGGTAARGATMRNPLMDPRVGDQLSWRLGRTPVTATVTRADGGTVQYAYGRVDLASGMARADARVTLAEWRDWSACSDLTLVGSLDHAYVVSPVALSLHPRDGWDLLPAGLTVMSHDGIHVSVDGEPVTGAACNLDLREPRAREFVARAVADRAAGMANISQRDRDLLAAAQLPQAMSTRDLTDLVALARHILAA